MNLVGRFLLSYIEFLSRASMRKAIKSTAKLMLRLGGSGYFSYTASRIGASVEGAIE